MKRFYLNDLFNNPAGFLAISVLVGLNEILDGRLINSVCHSVGMWMEIFSISNSKTVFKNQDDQC
jgi:hypothetical protein